MSVLHRKSPTVAVIMPAFNVAPFVRSATESVLTQTFTNFEMVVVDDGSTDGTGDIVQFFHDDRLRVVTQENSGSSAARNTGIQQTQAPFIAFIDGDDLWTKDKLEIHMRFLEEHPEVDLSFSHSCIIDETGHSTGRLSRPVRGPISFQELLIENVVANGSAVVMRREALERAGCFDIHLRSAVDQDAWLRIALLRPRNVYCIPKVLTLYRMRAGQITKDWRRMAQSWMTLLEKMRCLAPTEVESVEKQARAHLYRYLAYLAYENTEYRESASLLRTALGGGFQFLCRDRRTWLLAAALTARIVLPAKAHRTLDSLARQKRSRSKLPPNVTAPMHTESGQ